MKDRNIVILAGGISSRMKKPAIHEEELSDNLIKDADEKSKSMISLGGDGRPFLDYLLYNISEAGYKNVLIVIGEKDDSIKEYYNSNGCFPKLNIQFATQYIPEGREKPFGTADALFQGLTNVNEWNNECFAVVNSDNLYSISALKTLLQSDFKNAMIDYDSTGFEFEEKRVKAFAITVKNEKGFLLDIVEKPDEEKMDLARDKDGILRVSMNIFKLKYNLIYDYLKNCPVHPVRKEKELPTAIKMMISDHPNSLFCFPVKDHVPDLTNKEDILPTRDYLIKNFNGIKIN